MNEISENTFYLAKRDSGWRTYCMRSPLARTSYGEPLLVAYGNNWERAKERKPRSGYEYALVHSSTRPGFAHQAEWQYWSLMRRLINNST
jgi:hypothetical protein